MAIDINQRYAEVKKFQAEQIAWARANNQQDASEPSDSGTTMPEAENEVAKTWQAKREPLALEFQSISELRSKARKKYISGRSNMSKAELIMALRQKH